jgi:aminoglycoside phosphotransferase (APT) family kinase protein
VFTPPDDLSEPDLRAALEAGWSLRAESLAYLPVGFGSHHWELTDTAGARWFVTVDDLRTRRWSAGEPLAASYRRQRAALAAALALRAAGRDFVVAPRPARDGEPLTALGEAFTVAVYPLVAGESLDWDDYTPESRRTVLDLLVAVHTTPVEALRDDYAIQFRENIGAVPDDTGRYAKSAADLLAASKDGLRRALAQYDDLVAAAISGKHGLVLTHGEPHPGNVLRTDGGLLLIDWDTALLAPPERDLWDLDPGDGTLHAAYASATGTAVRPALLELYRLRWDLTEIALCLTRFREPHGDTEDDRETWTNLEEAMTNVVVRRA